MDPKRNLMKRAVPVIAPEKGVTEYLHSKFNDTLPKRRPEWDVPRNSPATELVAARRELALAELRLIDKREEHDIKRVEMDKQWDDLRNKELELKDSFAHFHKFVKENEEKRDRAEKKDKEEKELQSHRDEEITELTEKVDSLAAVKKSIESHLAEYRMYEEYLDKVVNETNEFRSIQEILNRYETLASARINLAERQDKDLKALEEARNEMIKMSKEKAQVIMSLNSELAQMQARYDSAQVKAAHWETAVSKVKVTASRKKLELSQVKNSCWNIYQQICRRKEIPATLDMLDYENQLIFIKRTVTELRKVVRIASRRTAKEAATAAAQRSTVDDYTRQQRSKSLVGETRVVSGNELVGLQTEE